MTEQSPPPPQAEANLATGDGPDLPACLLVVEDDPFLRRVVVRTLQTWGILILEAADGGAALHQVAEAAGELNLVLLDIMLPVLNGVEVARQLGRDYPLLPIVACSAAMNDEIEAELREVGVRHFLPKPYTAESLRATLRAAVDH